MSAYDEAYNARWYDPVLGRFAQADTNVPNPTDAKAFDRYAYVYNNPVRYNDPSGHCLDASGAENGQPYVGYSCSTTIIFSGYDGTNIDNLGPTVEDQMPAWIVDGNGSVIPQSNRIQYQGSHYEPTGEERDDGRPKYVKVGGKYQQAQNAIIADLYTDESVSIVGYSAGTSPAIMYTKNRVENGQSVSELILLGPDFTGAKEIGADSTGGFDDWKDDIDYLIQNGVDVTIVDDGSPFDQNGAQNYDRPKCANCGEFDYKLRGIYHYNKFPNQFPDLGTNTSTKLRDEVYR